MLPGRHSLWKNVVGLHVEWKGPNIIRKKLIITNRFGKKMTPWPLLKQKNTFQPLYCDSYIRFWWLSDTLNTSSKLDRQQNMSYTLGTLHPTRLSAEKMLQPKNVRFFCPAAITLKMSFLEQTTTPLTQK